MGQHAKQIATIRLKHIETGFVPYQLELPDAFRRPAVSQVNLYHIYQALEDGAGGIRLEWRWDPLGSFTWSWWSKSLTGLNVLVFLAGLRNRSVFGKGMERDTF